MLAKARAGARGFRPRSVGGPVIQQLPDPAARCQYFWAEGNLGSLNFVLASYDVVSIASLARNCAT
jgi:hypothetical protein